MDPYRKMSKSEPTQEHNVQINQGTEMPPMQQHNPQDPRRDQKTGNPTGTKKCGNLMRVVALGLRGVSLVLSLLCFIIIVTIKHFNLSDHYNYVFSVALISFIYNAVQNARGVCMLVTRKQMIGNGKLSAMIDFIGDQVITYMLISASSVGIAVANESRQVVEAAEDYSGVSITSPVVNKTAGGSSMLFLAFLALVIPTLFSGHKLSQAYTCSN